jgi:hypothetical protein
MSITFKQFLLEGGNFSIDGEEASRIDLNLHDRIEVIKTVKKSLTKLNSQFKLEQGLYLWKPHVLSDGKIYSGSTKHLFDETIDEAKLKKHKPTFGDIDLMIDIELKDKFKNFAEHKKSHTFEHLTLIGSKLSGEQVITLWHHKKFDINIQIDFEGVEFVNNEPSEWAHFSHSSSFDDTVNGVKGVFHKFLMSSLMAPKKFDAIEQLKTKQKEIIASTHTLSIKGLREKYKVTGEQEGKKVVVNTESDNFVTDFVEIFKEVFGKDPSQSDVKKFWSFKGIIDLIKKYMSEPEEEQVVESFIEKLFGEKAQSLYKGDNNRDLEEKMIAIRYLEDKLNIDIHKEKLNDISNTYYKKQK